MRVELGQEVKKALYVLVAEDTEDDYELLMRELRKAGYEPLSQRVDTAEAMSAALEEQAWDIVFSDWSMPQFDALGALAVLKDKGVDLPFIIVSGTIGEDVAVRAMRAGAHDFLLKNRLARLVPALERELREAKNRRERNKMHEQLLISDRMASVGILAAGVAHEINNPLASVIANLNLAVRDLAEVSSHQGEAALRDLREELSDARDSAERIRNIVRDLKLFSRADDEQRGPVDVRRVLESSLRMAWTEIRHRARLVKNYAVVPAVSANESRLGQVFLNLIVNAAQSMPEGRAEANEIRVATSLRPDGSVLVEITDTGSGMAPDVLKRLFTPFFTTKPAGIGTGLGLSICHRIISSIGGGIEVDSTLGVGSTFRVTLPVAASSSIETFEQAPRTIRAAVRRGRVLVIDDEPLIANVVRRTLAHDHEVTAVNRAQDALSKILSGERFDVILCDLMMPEMTGMDLHEELVESVPEQAAQMIFLTGGAFTARARAFLDQTANLRIEKPFDTVALRAIVNDRVK